MGLTDEERERYSRQIMLPEVGEDGQERLKAARVLVVGAGGLGSPVLMYLAAAGVGTLGIADFDSVDLSNLQRQVIHDTERIGVSKAESAKETIERLNPETRIILHKEKMTAATIGDIIKDYDFIVDCVDNFAAKFLINDACVIYKKPFCHAGVREFIGQLMTYVPSECACYRCLFEEMPPEGEYPESSTLGIFGSMPGIFGSMQALEAQKYIIGAKGLFTGRMLLFDGLKPQMRIINVPKNPACRVCGNEADITELDDRNYQ